MTTDTNTNTTAAMQLDMAEHDLCMECNPPEVKDLWFAPLYCDSCKDAKTRLFAYRSHSIPLPPQVGGNLAQCRGTDAGLETQCLRYAPKVKASERMVSICTQFVTHWVSSDGRKTEQARTPLTRVCAALPEYLERYIGYDGCVVLPEYFKTRIVHMSPVDGELNEVVTVTANVMDVCLF
jgi:hypothetical protein